MALLPDDAPEVRRALAGLGKAALPALRAAARSGAPDVSSRARAALLATARRRAFGRLVGHAAGIDRGESTGRALERGLWLLDRFADPTLDLCGPRAQLDEWAGVVKRRVTGRAAGARRALVLVDLLSGEAGLDGCQHEYNHPDNVSLSRTLERRAGLPLTLCAVYQAVARRAGLTAHLLPFPGHVLLELRDGGERLIVDPFRAGTLLTPRQCLTQLARHGVPFRERWLTPATDFELLLRQWFNLSNAVDSNPQAKRARRAEQRMLTEALTALAPERVRRAPPTP